MKNVTKKIQKIPYLFLLMLFSFVTASAQKGITVRGTVLDSNGETIIGASVTLKGNSSIGTITDIDGNFVLTVPGEKSVLIAVALPTELRVHSLFLVCGCKSSPFILFVQTKRCIFCDEMGFFIQTRINQKE